MAQYVANALGNPLATISSIGGTTAAGSGWPVKHAAVLEGDVILGGLMMVHSREDSITCGPIMPQGGIQALEAMLYTLDQVNKQQLLPNITLGAHLLDDCDKDTYGLEMAVDFIKEPCLAQLTIGRQFLLVQICFVFVILPTWHESRVVAAAGQSEQNAVIGDINEKWAADEVQLSADAAAAHDYESYHRHDEMGMYTTRHTTPATTTASASASVSVSDTMLHQHQHSQQRHERDPEELQLGQKKWHTRRSHYEALQLEQQQQQLGKQHWQQTKFHQQSKQGESKWEPWPLPEFVSDGVNTDEQQQQQQQQHPAFLAHPDQEDDESFYNEHFDLEQYQRYANIDILNAASPRSGRHRGRHVPPNNHNLLLPLLAGSTSSDVGGGGGGKYLRSLPDSVDFLHDRLYAMQPAQRHWPVKREAIVEGDLILGGLMMVHSREDSITCGPIMPQGGIQALEAMLYTIDRINEARLLPNITLGAHILDDCDKDSYGLEMAVDFIKGSISNIDDAEYHCNKTQVRKVISGVVGAASSVTSIQVANLLRLFRIPQVSYFSTSPELSNKQRFEYFSRTIPSDHYQVKAMVEIVKRMGWSYVSIIYEESNYGIKAFEELEDLLARHNICIAIKEKLVKDSGVAEEIAYDNIVQKLLTKPRARGAIIFGSDQEVREVMRAVRRANATGAFSWIGSDGWSARNLVSDGNEPEVEGTLSVQPQANPVRGFEEYFLNLTVENNQRNPWFVEFWEDHFQCRYPGSASTPYNNYTRTCTTKERLSRQNTDFEDQLQFVSDAVMAFAYALRDMHHDLCGGLPSLCDAMKPTKGADLLKYLRKVEFEGLSGDHFRFDGNGDGPARYNIIHFKQSLAGQYHWVKVGEYYEGELRLNMSEVKFKLLHPKPPESVCSLPCEVGQAKKYVEGESCCWHCFNCTTYQIRHPVDETHCLVCQLGTLPDAYKQYCVPIPEVYLRPESAWAIGAMAFSATGILITLFVVGVFIRHNDTPIVRASGRELSYILLAGIFMCYAVTFALVLKPSNIVCAIQRFSVGFCFTVVYAALLTKTNRIARIFKAGKQSAKRPSFISPKSQLVICTCLISVQILINGVWMVIAPSHAMHHHPTREDNLLVCDSYIDASYMIAFFYPIVLIVICTVYAVLTRKIPEAFNESKHIGFTMYTTCVIWLAFVPLYFGTANHVPLRITSMSVTISLSASVTIACLFSPKLYIILIRPERNVRQSMMPPRYGNMHRTAGTGPSSMMAAAVVTAATCAQEEKIQKHITPTNTEHSLKTKKLCEMATQTITISSIFTSLDSNAYNQIPYADQYVPNNTTTGTPTATATATNGQSVAADADQQVVANNNKINQQQHGQPAATVAVGPGSTASNHIASGNPNATVAAAAATTAAATTATVCPSDAVPTVAAPAPPSDLNGSQRAPVLQTNL
ncbi:metabotropic glutamate receptor 2 [Scaptodrosophila lebanonensis]|uniref:Metabotropic glutamate receptor 2 n=1 Tax=Drosophila lebanonensis TaxID=7225 RepID=A0A6J2UL01_DROLE|nr:metabotropic glutamate receptor 2 [Scaptodrosophila lebanonensis]